MDVTNEALLAPEVRRRNRACMNGIGPLVASFIDTFVNVTHVYVAEKFSHWYGFGCDRGHAESSVIGVFRTPTEAKAAIRKEMAAMEEPSPWANCTGNYDHDFTFDEWLRKCCVSMDEVDSNPEHEVEQDEDEQDEDEEAGYYWYSDFDASKDAVRAADVRCTAAIAAFYDGQDVDDLFDWDQGEPRCGWLEVEDENVYMVGLNMNDDGSNADVEYGTPPMPAPRLVRSDG